MRASDMYAEMVKAGASHDQALLAVELATKLAMSLATTGDALATSEKIANPIDDKLAIIGDSIGDEAPQWKINKRARDRARAAAKRQSRQTVETGKNLEGSRGTLVIGDSIGDIGDTLAIVANIESIPTKDISMLEVSKKDAREAEKPDQDFERFWRAFPKRAGSNSRKDALAKFKKYAARVGPETIIAGAERYAAYCRAEHKEKTRFILMAATWLNKELWNDNPTPSTDHRSDIDAAFDGLEARFKGGNSGHDGGGQQGGLDEPDIFDSPR